MTTATADKLMARSSSQRLAAIAVTSDTEARHPTMTTEITHERDPDTGHMRQIVSPQRLRQILRRDGESLVRPRDWTDDDEWEVTP